MTLIPGTPLGPYEEIISPVGTGGMGEVYRARDTRLDCTAALKILPDTLAADPQFRERFDREAKAISQLTHPHICTLYDVGEQQDTAYLVMEYLEGARLSALSLGGLDPCARYRRRNPHLFTDKLKAKQNERLDRSHRAVN